MPTSTYIQHQIYVYMYVYLSPLPWSRARTDNPNSTVRADLTFLATQRPSRTYSGRALTRQIYLLASSIRIVRLALPADSHPVVRLVPVVRTLGGLFPATAVLLHQTEHDDQPGQRSCRF